MLTSTGFSPHSRPGAQWGLPTAQPLRDPSEAVPGRTWLSALGLALHPATVHVHSPDTRGHTCAHRCTRAHAHTHMGTHAHVCSCTPHTHMGTHVLMHTHHTRARGCTRARAHSHRGTHAHVCSCTLTTHGHAGAHVLMHTHYTRARGHTHTRAHSPHTLGLMHPLTHTPGTHLSARLRTGIHMWGAAATGTHTQV